MDKGQVEVVFTMQTVAFPKRTRHALVSGAGVTMQAPAGVMERPLWRGVRPRLAHHRLQAVQAADVGRVGLGAQRTGVCVYGVARQ